MSEPLDIRRRTSPAHLRIFGVRLAILVAGLGIVVSCTVAFLTQPLDTTQKTNAAGLVVIGLFQTGLGGRRTWKARRVLLRPVVIRLDDAGVHLTAGAVERPFPVELAWADTASVMVGPAPAASVPGGVVGDWTMLRFVPRSEQLVVGAREDTYSRRKAAALGMSTTEASLTLLQERTSAFRVPLVLDWVRRQRPEVPVIDYRIGV